MGSTRSSKEPARLAGSQGRAGPTAVTGRRDRRDRGMVLDVHQGTAGLGTSDCSPRLHTERHVHTSILSAQRSHKDAGSPKEIATGYLTMYIMTVPLEIVSCISVSCCVLLQSAVLCQIPLSTFQSPSPPGLGFVFAILYLRKLLQYLIF